MKPCYVCEKTIAGRSKYCPRCKQLFYTRHDHALKPDDLRDAYDKASGCFRCIYSGICLDLEDPDSPWYLSTDHFIPGKKEVVISSRLMNLMKSSMTGREFIKVVPHLDDVLQAKIPFNKRIIRFTNWNYPPKTKAVKYPVDTALRLVNAEFCKICQKPPLRYSYYCARCREVLQQHGEVVPRLEAMINSYDKELDAFRCYYTGVIVELSGRYGPWHISFDHLVPGDDRHLAVTALWVNRMKTFLTELQFRAVIRSLANHIRTGAPFDKSVLSAQSFARTVRKVGAGNTMVARRL